MVQTARGPTSEQFRVALAARLTRAADGGSHWLDVVAADLHREVGAYPGKGHRMPACCAAMHALRRAGDEVLEAPPSGQGSRLTIRYKLPR